MKEEETRKKQQHTCSSERKQGWKLERNLGTDQREWETSNSGNELVVVEGKF